MEGLRRGSRYQGLMEAFYYFSEFLEDYEIVINN